MGASQSTPAPVTIPLDAKAKEVRKASEEIHRAVRETRQVAHELGVDTQELKAAVQEVAQATSCSMQPGGAYHTYRRLKLERDQACRYQTTKTEQDRCVQLQMTTLEAQWKAMEETLGGALLVDLFETH